MDDHDDTRELLREALSAAGHRVRAFAGAAELLATLASEPAQIVVTDLQLPGMSGTQLAAALRSGGDPSRRPRIVAVTGAAAPTTPDPTSPFDAHLQKPVDLDELLALLQALARA